MDSLGSLNAFVRAVESRSFTISQPFVAPRLSIVVLPFANLGNDPERQYFADGVTEDLTTDLSRLAGMFVISRNTAFTYRNKPVDAKQIGHELGVRYVLEGSVRRSGNQLRVNTQLIDAETDPHLWAERFDRDMGGPNLCGSGRCAPNTRLAGTRPKRSNQWSGKSTTSLQVSMRVGKISNLFSVSNAHTIFVSYPNVERLGFHH
jgi:TolB-like protein